MVTNPVEQITRQRYRTPFQADLVETVQKLAAVEPSTGAPYLTLSVDWQPEGSNPNRRAGRQFVEKAVDDLLDEYEPHTPAHESLSADVERIRTYLDEEIDAAVQGVIIVACSANSVFECVPLGRPVDNSIEVGPTPALFRLARLAEDESTYAVLLADQREAHVSLLTQDYRRRAVELAATDYPRKQAQGGWSQRRFQARADERVDAFARTIAEETRQVLEPLDVNTIILAGEEQMRTAILNVLPDSIRKRVVGNVHIDAGAKIEAVIEETSPLAEQAERDRESAAVQKVRDNAGPGGTSVTGAVDTLTAMQGGQVMTLVVNDDFEQTGWADFTFPVFGAGAPPKTHPAGGDRQNIVPVQLQQELVRQAVQTGADVEIVRSSVPITQEELTDIPDAGEAIPRSEAAQSLDELGGVGAILRFALDAEHATANL